MNGFYLVYDTGQVKVIHGKEYLGLPHAVYTEYQVKKDHRRITEWPEDQVVIHFWNDSAHTITRQTVGHYRLFPPS